MQHDPPTDIHTRRSSEPDAATLTALADVLAGMPMATAVFTRDGRLCAANDAARTWFAIDVRAPLSSQQERVVLAAFVDDFAPLLAQVRDGAAEAIAVVQPEPPAWLELRVAACHDRMLLVTVTDVTAREERRLQLARTEREAVSILELMPASVRVADLSGKLVRMNASALAEHTAPYPQTLRELWERDQPRRPDGNTLLTFIETPAMRALAGATVRRELTLVRRTAADEPHVIEVSATPVLSDEGRVVGAVVIDRDITDWRRLERSLDAEVRRSAALESHVLTEADRIEQIVAERARALAEREESMARDRRLAAIGQLAAGVMHDVNNALNPIMAAAYLLRHYAESPDAVREYADRIKTAAETGAATASRVGRFIRQEPMHGGTEELLDLSELAEEVLELTEPMRQRGATDGTAFRVERHYGLGVLTRGIPGEIREALFNLVGNAMDAMKTGGTLTVETRTEGDEAVVTVRDTGSGMTPEVRERAFEPFFTTKGARGSGLGLAEVYGIARRHRGTATIDSTLGEGTAVTIRLPLERAVAPPDVAEMVPASSVPLHILVVEDHEDGREFLRRLLHAHGHTVEAVASCADARASLASSAASSYHLMLTDVGLPDGSGWDLVTYARERWPALRVGVITGWEPMVSSTEAVGAEFVLRKPLRAAELLAHIAGRKSPALPG